VRDRQGARAEIEAQNLRPQPSLKIWWSQEAEIPVKYRRGARSGSQL